MNYRSLDNKVHSIAPEFAHMLPNGCVPITDAEAEALRPVSPPLTYKQERAAAYPPVTDGLDAIVKGGQALDDYKAACMAVKAKYPKV